MSRFIMARARVLTLSLFVAAAGMSTTAAQADDWLEKAFRSQAPVASSKVTRTTRKAARATPGSRSTTINTASKSTRAKPITIRAARTDDVKPTLRRQASAPVTSGNIETGIASYYWQPQPVASGGRFNPEAMTAAHKYLPFGTRVRVTRADNGRSVEVVINDRGPFIAGRIIDLSRRAARDIGMTDVGITRVNVAVLGR
jgi:rare lipoprotein A (peptidoglycan hydrolase)